MRMNCDRLMGEIKPYEILCRYREKYGAGEYSQWGTWRLSSAHQTETGRDNAYKAMKDSDIKECKYHLNEREYEAKLARERKVDPSDIAGALNLPVGIDPGTGFVSIKPGDVVADGYSWREL